MLITILLGGFVCLFTGLLLGHRLRHVSAWYAEQVSPERRELVDVPPAAVCTPARVVMTAGEGMDAYHVTQLAGLARQFAALQAENERRAFLTLPVQDLQDTRISLN